MFVLALVVRDCFIKYPPCGNQRIEPLGIGVWGVMEQDFTVWKKGPL